MCEGPSLEAKTITPHVANLNHPSSPPSLGSTGSLGSAPPEGGVSKYPGALVDLELGEVGVGEEQHPLSVELPLNSLSLRPTNIGSWKTGCGLNLSPTSPSGNPTPYQPVKPTKATPSTAPTSPTTTSPTTTIQTISHTLPTTTNIIRTATGGTKVFNKNLKKTSSQTPTYVCDGIGCAYTTNSPYKFINHQKMPHQWRPGSQNWCLAKAKSLAQGYKLVGLKASCPTKFTSADIRVKKGELPLNLIQTKCNEESTPLTSLSPNLTHTYPPIKLNTPTIAPNFHGSNTSTSSTTTSTPNGVTMVPSIQSPPHLFPNPTTITPPNSIEDTKLYFPISHFLWKRKLPPPIPNPLLPPWALFPKPRGNKVKSSSHLKWDRRLCNGTTYSFGANDPSLGYSSHTVTHTEGTGIPQFEENGSWAKYSHILVTKIKLQDAPLNQNIKSSSYPLKHKRGLSRPKSGQNTTHKAHGISYKDHVNGIGKQLLSEVPCQRKYNTSFSPKAKASSSTTNYKTTSSTTQGSPLYMPYPSKRTKWTRPMGGSLKGGGLSQSVTIKLFGSSPYNSQNDAQKLIIYCLDSVIECPLSLIDHHSTKLKNLLLENENCR